jgi:cobaltochelatase CobS
MNASNTPRKQALRQALRSHSGWQAYRVAKACDLGTMTMAQLESAYAELFGKPMDGAAIEIETSEAIEIGAADSADSDDDDALLANIANTIAALKAKRAAALTEQRVIELIGQHAAAGTVLTLKRQDQTEWKSEGTVHPQFPTLLKVLSARQASGAPVNVWIAGPAGSGKTHAAEQAASALSIAFYFNGALSMPHELLGFVDAAGKYHSTPFRQAYEHGGLYLFDEVDASETVVLLALNAALANGVCAFPDSATPIRRHADFRCVAAGNTYGQGATADYIGRAKIDAAFLSRFPVKLTWNYDVALEQNISGNADFAKRVQAARARAQAAGVKIIIDPRHSMAGAALIAAGFKSDEAAELTYLSALTADQRKIVEGR